MYRIKMFFKFIIWLIKRIFMFNYIYDSVRDYIMEWKKQCRKDFGLAMLYYLLTTVSAMASGIVGKLLAVGESVTRAELTESVFVSFWFGTIVFVFVILLASYDKFIEEYEQSFTKLKE